MTAPQRLESAVQTDNKGNFVYVMDRDDKLVRCNMRVGDVRRQPGKGFRR